MKSKKLEQTMELKKADIDQLKSGLIIGAKQNKVRSIYSLMSRYNNLMGWKIHFSLSIIII